MVYDLLATQEESDLDTNASYYLTTNYFDISSGVQANLPLALWNYEFKNQKSLDSFLATLNDAPTYFKKYVELEKTRQKKGYGMSQTYMNDVLEAIHTINTSDQNYILEATFHKIDELTFIDDHKKSTYKTDIQNAFTNTFMPAWLTLENDLSSVKISKKGEGELASYKEGKTYYLEMLKEQVDVDSIKEYTNYLKQCEKEIQQRLLALMSEYPELADLLYSDESTINDALNNLHFTDLTSAQEVIEDLEKKVATKDMFPTIQTLEYQMNIVPDSMKDTIQAAAAYYLSAFDDTSGKGEQMILNGAFEQSDFTTIAHESFPGHMYQHNYFKNVKHNILRDVLSNSAYVEGWATYVENEVCAYSDNPAVCHLNNINSQLTYLKVIELDKKIHYDGISRKEAYTFLSDNFGLNDEENLDAQYTQLLENPAVFGNYYLGYYQFLSLKENAKEKWDDEYSDYQFHKLVLDLGPLPFNLLEKYAKLD
ncbi:MAG: DUF885 family protein [Erysipelotrichia bacterium]|nr:DUF885 family protein [Erysipelotrichia bacterium]NCC54088.1 DUF885 family protein [Erysipelotrichia bacterium]